MRNQTPQTSTDCFAPSKPVSQVGCGSPVLDVACQSTPTRNQFTTWLKQLSKQQRYLALQIKNPTLNNTLRHKYQTIIEVENENLWNLSTTSNNKTKPIPKKYKVFLESLLFLSEDQYLDCLGFDLNFVDYPEKIYDVLVTDSVSFQPLASNPDYRFEEVKDKNQWIAETIKYIRNNLFFNFYKRWNKNLLQEQKNRKKQFSIFWKYLPDPQKQKILFLGHSSLSELITELQLRKKIIEPFEIQKQIQELLKLDKNQFCNRIFKCKLKRCTNPVYEYYELVYYQWKEGVLKKKRKDKKYYGKKKNKTTINNHRRQRKRSLDVWSNETNETDHHNKIQKQEKQFKNMKEVKEKNEPYQMQKIQNLEPESKVYTGKKAPCLRRTPKKNMWVFEQSKEIKKEKSVEQKIQQNVTKLSEQIFQEARELEERRCLGYERIQAFFLAYELGIRLYGSCANGLAIKTSDIDIAVNENILCWYPYLANPKAKLIAALNCLSQLLSELPWIVECKPIDTAKIPIIKLKLDTEIPVTQDYIAEDYRLRLNRKIHNPGVLCVDITIQTPNLDTSLNHLGLLSTDFINRWFTFMPVLRPITLILKSYLYKHELNENYNRGLNTYSLFIMLISYIKHLGWQNKPSISEVLERVLLFYGSEFDQSKFRVDLRHEQVMLRKTEVSKCAELEVCDPLDNGTIMTKNCYKFSEIKELFLSIHKELYMEAREKPDTQLLTTYSNYCNI